VLFHDYAVASWGWTIMVSGKHKSPTRSFKVYPDLSLPDIRHILDSQVGVADYLQLGVEGEPSPDHSYTGNGSSAGGCPCRQARPDPTIMLTLRTLTCSSGFHVLRAFTTNRALLTHGSKQRTMSLRHLVLGPLFC
jgi:hypothetical protein